MDGIVSGWVGGANLDDGWTSNDLRIGESTGDVGVGQDNVSLAVSGRRDGSRNGVAANSSRHGGNVETADECSVHTSGWKSGVGGEGG